MEKSNQEKPVSEYFSIVKQNEHEQKKDKSNKRESKIEEFLKFDDFQK